MRAVFCLFALLLADLLLNCSGKASQDQANDTIPYSDTIENNSSTIPNTTASPEQGNERIIVGSDSSVNHSTLDTIYYAILRYGPVPADFSSLLSITNHVADLDLGESGERFVVHLITSELLEKVETGITFGTMSYRTESLLHNYLYVIELKDGLNHVLSDYYVGDSQDIYNEIGANEESNFYSFAPIEVNDNSFVITTVHQDELKDDSPGTVSLYLLKNNLIISVLDFPIQSMSFPNSYRWEKLETASNGFFDLALTELGPAYQPSSKPITKCRWDGKAYVCDSPKE